MAAGLGTRLRPLTHEIPKPLVPVANRPIMEHILELLANHGMTEVVANLHWFGDTVREPLRRRLEARDRAHLQRGGELLGTAGGVRNVPRLLRRRAVRRDGGRRAHRHRPRALARTHRATTGSRPWRSSGSRTPPSTGSSSPAPTGRVQGFQEKPEPGRGALGPRQLHDLRARARDLRPLPRPGRGRLRARCLPGAARGRRAVRRPRRPTTTGTTSARCPSTCRATSTCSPARSPFEPAGELIEDSAAGLGDGVEVEGPCSSATGSRSARPSARGSAGDRPRRTIGAGARLRESVLLAGTEVPATGCWRARSPATRAPWRGFDRPRPTAEPHRLRETRDLSAGVPYRDRYPLRPMLQGEMEGAQSTFGPIARRARRCMRLGRGRWSAPWCWSAGRSTRPRSPSSRPDMPMTKPLIAVAMVLLGAALVLVVPAEAPERPPPARRRARRARRADRLRDARRVRLRRPRDRRPAVRRLAQAARREPHG